MTNPEDMPFPVVPTYEIRADVAPLRAYKGLSGTAERLVAELSAW